MTTLTTTKHRPILQPHAPAGIDPRTRTRLADPVERDLAARALDELAVCHNRIVLVPAPRPSFDGHKIRVQEARNPKWYRRFVKCHRDPTGRQVKRRRVERALVRVAYSGRVRGNGLERRLLEILKEVP